MKAVQRRILLGLLPVMFSPFFATGCHSYAGRATSGEWVVPKGATSVHPSKADRKPRIVSQSWKTETRRGKIVLDPSRCKDRNAALAWARDEYLPEYCRVLGVAAPADNPTSAPAASVQINSFETLQDGNVQIEFSVDE